MTRRSPRLEWAPPLLVGASAAVVAEVAMSVLLYGGAGFVRSLTTVLAVEGLAFAGGLWSGPTDGPDLVDRVRRRWLLCLFTFIAASLFGMAWSLFPEVSAGGLGQGAGLALLAAVPLYSAGTVLGGMSVVAASDPGERLAAPGPSAAVGAALGFVLTGFLLPRVPLPASLVLACLVLLSLGGMIYGGVLAARTDVRVLAARPGRGSDVRVQERRTPIDGVAVRELLEGAVARRWVGLDGPASEPWDVSVVRALMPGTRGPGGGQPGAHPAGHGAEGASVEQPRHATEGFRVLLVGGGSSTVPATVLGLHPSASVDVLERTAAVVELGREHFDTGLSTGREDRSSVAVGNLDDGIVACDGGYDVIVLDAAALAPIGGVAGLSTMARRRLPGLLRPGGTLAWGSDATGFTVQDAAAGWRSRRYRRPVRHRADVEFETVVLVQRDDGERWTPVVGGFKEVPNP